MLKLFLLSDKEKTWIRFDGSGHKLITVVVGMPLLFSLIACVLRLPVWYFSWDRQVVSLQEWIWALGTDGI